MVVALVVRCCIPDTIPRTSMNWYTAALYDERFLVYIKEDNLPGRKLFSALIGTSLLNCGLHRKKNHPMPEIISTLNEDNFDAGACG